MRYTFNISFFLLYIRSEVPESFEPKQNSSLAGTSNFDRLGRISTGMTIAFNKRQRQEIKNNTRTLYSCMSECAVQVGILREARSLFHFRSQQPTTYPPTHFKFDSLLYIFNVHFANDKCVYLLALPHRRRRTQRPV